VTLYERFEKVSELDMTMSTRRRLLSRAGKACLGLAVGAAGLSRVERARAQGSRLVGCCVLAYENDCTHCTGQGYDCGSGCTRWAWYCVDNVRRYWQCGECYSGGSCAGCSCGKIVTSAGRGGLPTLGGR
jgi:hypothetical protein